MKSDTFERVKAALFFLAVIVWVILYELEIEHAERNFETNKTVAEPVLVDHCKP